MSSRGDAPVSKRARRSRGKGLRVRTGCSRCKARHVKCDESRPACGACEKIGCRCEYPDRQSDAAGAFAEPGSRERQSPGSGTAGWEGEARLGPPSGEVENRGEGPPESDPFDGMQNIASTGDIFTDEALYTAGPFETSPESAWSGWANVSAETAPLKWFGLVATDAARDESLSRSRLPDSLTTPAFLADDENLLGVVGDTSDPPGSLLGQTVKYCSQDEISLSTYEAGLLQHFILRLSGWIDVTDCDRSFAIVVSQMALRNRGLMNAILALSARHVSLTSSPESEDEAVQSAKTHSLQYYYQTLSYLQQEMRSTPFLTSDELLATIILISTYEMIDGSGGGWERHLKGVFWIQRSQLIHGESGGLKQCIWWAWLRQDIWVAYREQRKILSYYHLTRELPDLGFWELVNRAVWLLGQCINFASLKDQFAGQSDIQGRVDRSNALWGRLEAWTECFARFDRRLPATANEHTAFKPIWVNPPAAALAIQSHHFSKILLLEHTPATGGLKELVGRQSALQASVEVICGIACCIFDDGALIVSTMCLYAAALHVKGEPQREHILELLHTHRSRTGWPSYSLEEELRQHWTSDAN